MCSHDRELIIIKQNYAKFCLFMTKRNHNMLFLVYQCILYAYKIYMEVCLRSMPKLKHFVLNDGSYSNILYTLLVL